MKNINYGLIVSDFDGTLASSDGTVTEKNKKAIEEYIENGGIFAISSGRLPAAILPQAKSLGLKGLICCGQGTSILNIETSEILFEARLTLETTLASCRKMEEMGLHILAFDLFEYYSNKKNESLDFYERISGTNAKVVLDRPLSALIEEKELCVYKLIALVNPKDNARILNELTNAGLPQCAVTKSMDFIVEIVNKDYSKGTAIAFLADHYGVPIEKTVGMGDNFNDAEMIKTAGVGAAVSNAEQMLKDKADYICENSNNESAVAEVIYKFGICNA